MKNTKKRKGFTLVEVLVVVLIVGILAAIAIPSYHFTIERSRATQGITSLTQIAKAQKTYNAKRGKYAESMIGLPLDMKDSDGSEATGAEFADQYFDYKIFGDEFERARATRNTGEYELSVEYETGEIFCRPIEHKICQNLNLAEGEELIHWPQKTECDPAEYGRSKPYYVCRRTLYKDGTKRDMVCWVGHSSCSIYNNEKEKIGDINGNINQGGKRAFYLMEYFPGTNQISKYSHYYDDDGSLYSQTTYNPDGSLKSSFSDFSYKSYASYSDTGREVVNIRPEGIDVSTYDTSNNRLTYKTYDLSGNLTSALYYVAGNSSAAEVITYDSQGNVMLYRCNFGPCSEEGHTRPSYESIDLSSFPADTSYCQDNEDDCSAFEDEIF